MTTAATAVEATKSAFGDRFNTPPPKPATKPADAHQGEIVSVEKLVTEKGSTGLQFNLRSTNEGFSTKFTIWPVQSYVADIFVDPATLPTAVVNPNTGKTSNWQQRYAQDVRNSKRTGTIETIFNMADAAGRVNGETFATFDELVSTLNEVAAGLPIVFTRKPKKDDNPQYDGNLEVNGIYPAEEAFNTKRFKNLRRAWESA